MRSVIEIDFVDLLQDHDDCSLNELVFHAGDPKRSRLSIPFRDVLTQAGLRSITAAMKTLKKIPQVVSQMCFVVFDRDVVDSRCLVSVGGTHAATTLR